MASFTLTSTRFPNGTVVKAYPASNWAAPGPPSGAPLGSATNEQTMTSNALTFTGLTENVGYYAVAEVAGAYVYVGFRIAKRSGPVGHGELEALEGEVAPLDTDGTFAAKSNVRVASQKATETYVDIKTTPAGLIYPLAMGTLRGANVGGFTANRLNLSRYIVPKTGKIRQLWLPIKTASENVRAAIYDTAETTRHRLWESGSVATVVSKESEPPLLLGDANLSVTQGQHIDIAVNFQNATAEAERLNLGVQQGLLPAAALVSPQGGKAWLTPAYSPGSFTTPETLTEASFFNNTFSVAVFARIE